MKGIINKGIQELVESQFGLESWETIRRDAGCSEPSFSPSVDYPDQMTVDLIMASSRHLSMPADDVMMEFGKFWAPHTAQQSYPSLYALAGANARDFLKNMDRVHRQVTISIPNAHPPPLDPEDLPGGGLAIHYRSDRKLCPVLHGLILGVGVHFDETIAISETKCMRRGDSECLFEVRFD